MVVSPPGSGNIPCEEEEEEEEEKEEDEEEEMLEMIRR